MKDKFIVVEAGSTVTKGYLYENGKIKELPFEFIEFKKHYSSEKKILTEDKEKLFNYINKLKEITNNIHIYGTSIFRIITDEERKSFLEEMSRKTGLSLRIVSSDEEEKYTVDGIVSNIDYKENIAVVISGGGSTEIAIVSNKEIIEKVHLDFGGVDITNMYPDLANDIATTDINEVVNYIKNKLNNLKSKADILITGGSTTKYFRETAHYKFINDLPFTYNKNEFVVMDKSIYEQDKDYFYKTSLEEMKKNMPDTPNWWNPSRAINCFVLAVFKTVGAKYVLASNINMIYGIIEEVKKDNKNNI
jgi:hypothetical protein